MDLAVLLAVGDRATRERWARLLLARGMDVAQAGSGPECMAIIRRRQVDTVVLGGPVTTAGRELDLLEATIAGDVSLCVILVVERGSEQLAVAAFRAGAADYLREPVSDHELVASVARLGAARQRQANRAGTATGPGAMVGGGPAMREVRAYIEKVARTDSNVLITGETGVGKELVAEMIHARSARGRRPCVAINCAAIPDTLLESELFGFERGAFTGADSARDGTLKSADGGSVFFDEVGDMGLAAQAKILRAIEAREVHRLGGRTRVPLDIRVIAATNHDLERLVDEGHFRKDLYYRLNVARVHLAPLRDRIDDLDALLQFYIGHFNRRFGRHVEGFTPDAVNRLRRYHWPGNIRELKNLVEAVYVSLDGQRVTHVDLPEPFKRTLDHQAALTPSERERLVNALFATNWNKSRAAEELHWSRMTLYRKLAKYQVFRTDGARRKQSS